MRVLLLLCVWFVGGCAAEQQRQELESTDSAQQKMSNDVDEAIKRAVERQDYRLYLTQGRRPVLPGLEQVSVESIKGSCGTKYLSETGDVIRGEDAKQDRIARYNFAKAYNLQMYALCKKLRRDN
ncbi:hypothetical protein [Pseudoalteromonas luteoviolacea]|uniref:Lipoprotein n=1 Tax=Pseudoalteromonas luteoviolacea NCIMB 1942 TaxID=1365253 RepID=A0A167HUH7_9GAMM|nr:hypothetical protein [Pseudoalteromonas luteoviolacea]KZN58544.1 hypothetical protein N482_21685 [Pseudoalteromonas luteoviolacea NCIMB 1942]KZX01565.1 hypothetical protein JL49_05515 [Pseudoalteromonas luteoviolacea]